MPFKIYLAGLVLPLFMSGCAWLGVNMGYQNDPLTGGIDTQTSSLLNVPLPAGLQRYASHGYSANTPEGREGLETLRGNVDANAAAAAMFNTLKSAGWQLRMSCHKGQRAINLYQKNNEFALLAFHPQGMLTILEIWTGPRLPDGAALSLPQQSPEEDLPSISGEEYEPIDEYDAPRGETANSKVETWGGQSGIKEREL